MTDSEGARIARGMSGMRHPIRLIDQVRDAYVPRFGQSFATAMVRGAVTVMIGAYVMVLGLIGMFVIGTLVLFTTGSLAVITDVLYGGLGVIALGFVINGVGVSMRTRAIKRMSAQIIAFDPKVTDDGAGRLIHNPHLFDRFTAQHPGFQPREI